MWSTRCRAARCAPRGKCAWSRSWSHRRREPPERRWHPNNYIQPKRSPITVASPFDQLTQVRKVLAMKKLIELNFITLLKYTKVTKVTKTEFTNGTEQFQAHPPVPFSIPRHHHGQFHLKGRPLLHLRSVNLGTWPLARDRISGWWISCVKPSMGFAPWQMVILAT